jgi:hypothetical protein
MNYKNKADFIVNANNRIDIVLLNIIEILKTIIA